jgi:UDP-N-acetylmuramate dehydrogenase
MPLEYRAVCDQLGVPKGSRVPLGEAANAVLSVRRGKGMVLEPGESEKRSAGSVFLSPVVSADMAAALRRTDASVNEFPDGSTRVSASWLIKQAGFALGQRLAPGVRMSRKHFTLVTDEGATAAGFAEASRIVATDVLRATGVRLTPEPDLFGDEPVYRELVEAALPSSAN